MCLHQYTVKTKLVTVVIQFPTLVCNKNIQVLQRFIQLDPHIKIEQ